MLKAPHDEAPDNTSDNTFRFEALPLKNVNYAFFTNENGKSSGGYLIDNTTTRNVNIMAPQDTAHKDYDPASEVVSNIVTCFKELSDKCVGVDNIDKFFMHSNLNFKNGSIIEVCTNQEALNALIEKSTTVNIELHPDMAQALSNENIHVLNANAVIFKGMPEKMLSLVGPSADAHPIIMIDDQNQVASYISGSHMAIADGILEKVFQTMCDAGAEAENIKVLIGPGLGPYSFEFNTTFKKQTGEVIDTQDYFNAPEALTAIPNIVGGPTQKYLINIKKLVETKLNGLALLDNILNIDIDTMGADLYDRETLEKREINFEQLKREQVLVNSARRTQKTEGQSPNPGVFSTFARHGAGIFLGSPSSTSSPGGLKGPKTH